MIRALLITLLVAGCAQGRVEQSNASGSHAVSINPACLVLCIGRALPRDKETTP
jgi:hypothetical protein